MESKKEEALSAKLHAEKRFSEKDFVGAKNFAVKAQILFPEMEGISQMVATFDTYVASEGKINGEVDFYSVLGLKPSADRSMLKKQYKRLAVLLHPDKNRTVGADGAFRLISEAWTHLSDKARRASYDLKRNVQLSSAMVAGATYGGHCSNTSIPPTFWTVCTSCQVQYEYFRKYVNKRLSCKNCRGTFMAVELGTAPISGAFPVSQTQWSFAPENGYNSHGYTSMTFIPADTVIVSGNGVPTHHSGRGSEFVSNFSLQWSTSPGTSTGFASHNGFTTTADAIYQSNGHARKSGRKATAEAGTGINSSVGSGQSNGTKVTRPYKRRKVYAGCPAVYSNDPGAEIVREALNPDENGCSVPRFSITNESSLKRPIPPPIDFRAMLIEKGRKLIQKKLDEIKLASAENSQKLQNEASKSGEAKQKANVGVQLEPKKFWPVTLTVPDSDFHDFDKDRTEECFQPKQIWALYDEEDGMPRLYCLIRQILSVNPFRIFISYLGSKSDTEFGDVKWIDYGFTKSCGHFRATTTDIVEEVNMFSHILSQEKAGRGGCVRIFPRSGDIWAVYRNWSPDWSRSTPYDVRHQYDMVEILGDYSEEFGVSVAPLVKLESYKTVYRRNPDKNAVRWIPRREMVRFSHQVPSCFLKEMDSLPEGCRELDPAATPDVLLPLVDEAQVKVKGEVTVNGAEVKEKCSVMVA